jgi:AraC-like DNA-binding protein
MFRYFYPPHPGLRNYISHYLVLEINKLDSGGELCSYPDGICTMNILYSPDLPDFVFPDKTVGNKRGFISGIFESGVKLYKAGKYQSIMALFTPFGAFEMFGIPPSEYRNTFVSLEDIMGNEGHGIIEKINVANSTALRVKYLNEFFLEYVGKTAVRNSLCKSIATEIVNRKGVVQISELSERFGVSGRQMDRIFLHYLGVSPKHYARIVRLGAAYKMLLTTRMNVQDVIFDLGYYDQAHLIHNFTWYSDITPRDFFKKPEKTIFPAILCVSEKEWEKYEGLLAASTDGRMALKSKGRKVFDEDDY